MKRYKRHKVKTEMPETSTSHNRQQEEHDLAYYIHDRVELMHQVFSVLKYKELKAMAPACVRNISVDDLQELCTEELLGISSKRLCAILDGADPPSDTESSSQSATEPLETISLDSISSDEELLSQEDKTKKKKGERRHEPPRTRRSRRIRILHMRLRRVRCGQHKHRHRDSKSKSKRKRSKDTSNEQTNSAEKSAASRAGLTVLELLELQARARAIRAQLQLQHNVPVSESAAVESTHSTQSSEDEVEIKEEPAEVVEISSDEEKPKIEKLEISTFQQKSPEPQSKTVTKRVNDLVITVPQQKTQKIKLNRNKSAPQDTNTNKATQNNEENTEKQPEKTNKDVIKDKTKKDKTKDAAKIQENAKKDKSKDKSKKKKKQRLSNASDNDEITLQLSDTEKMDLLEDLDRKNYDNVSSDTSSDSETDTAVTKKTPQKHIDRHSRDSRNSRDDINVRENRISRDSRKSKDENDGIVEAKQEISIESDKIEHDTDKTENIEVESIEIKEPESKTTENVDNNHVNATSGSNSQTDVENVDKVISVIDKNNAETVQSIEIVLPSSEIGDATFENVEKEKKTPKIDDKNKSSQEDIIETEGSHKDTGKELSEGELSDRESSEVEAIDLKPEVVCISDEEEGKHKKKKKKKDKKSKKDKKDKKIKKKDFHESGDQNFHNITDSNKVNGPEETTANKTVIDGSSSQIQDETQKDSEKNTVEIDLTTEKSQDSEIDSKNMIPKPSSPDPNVNTSEIEEESANEIVEISDEVYELSDDSSNEDENETRNVLSKEPTASEIEALSAKIDEIERVEVITAEEINEYESKNSEEVTISWKDRYLDSKKVKKVLNTSNILNALRKKNRELKKRLEESKLESQETTAEVQEEIKETEIAEGSIEQYNTLEASTKFVDPVKELPINDTLKKDAKQLLKMYKKLLKYNDINRKKDPSKKKKKKKKGKKDKDKEQESVEDKTSA